MLENRAGEMIDYLRNVDALVDVKSSLEAGSPELQVIFNRDRIASFGLDIRSLTSTLRNRVLGVIPTRFRERERQIDIRIRNPEESRSKAEDISNLIIPGPSGSKLRLQTVAEILDAHHQNKVPGNCHIHHRIRRCGCDKSQQNETWTENPSRHSSSR